MRLRRWLVPVLLATSTAVACAQACLPTPEAAAQSVIGLAAMGPTLATGFRVQDLQVDSLTRRVWVRVGHCDAPGAPFILVPVHAPLSGTLPVRLDGIPNLGIPVGAADITPFTSPRPFAVHAGDAVLVTLTSSSVQMELEGTAEQAAALGDTVGIVLRQRGDEPRHRMRGILRADHHVEVRQ